VTGVQTCALPICASEEFLADRPEFISDEVPLWPERFVAELGRVLPRPAVVVADPGTATPYLSAYWPVPQAGRWFLAPRAHGALGYALAAVAGAHLAKPEAKAVALMGDGGFAMSAGELETFVRLNLPVTLVVLRNAVFGWVKAGQRVRGEKYFGVDFSATDHVRVAQAYGLKAWRAERPADLAPALSQAFTHPGPSLVEIPVRPLHLTRAPVSKWVA
jgi:acetolactate synthase-1/2/3 large subunit